MNLSSLTQKRREHVQSCQLNDDHSHSIIANLYSDSTHFLYELLQNAQDAEATYISFTLYPDRLETSHNGRAFSYDDVEAITTIGSSTKAGEANKIGKFGAGFKSVFSITNTPKIHSIPYHFQISDYIIPSSIEPFTEYNKELTTVILPFDKYDVDNNNNLYSSIEKKLKSIGKDEILFLSNLQCITWEVGELNGFVKKQIDDEEGFRSFVTIQSDSQEQRFELYVLDFTIDSKPLQTKIAFALDENDNYKSSGNSYPLFVFFPTVIQSNVQFLIHAPYKTTPNRETINFTDSQNKKITDNIVELYNAVIIDMADRKRFNVDIMQLLPLSSNSGEIAQILFQASISLFKTHPLIPTREDSYALPNELFFLSVNLESELFYTAKIQTLFDKSDWINEIIKQSAYYNLKRFITGYLGIREINLNEIIDKIDESFLIKQSNEWIGRLYGEFSKMPSHVNGYLANRPLACLNNGRHIPFKSPQGEIQVYLPTELESRFQCLSYDVCVLPEAKKFLTDVGITEPNVVDELKTFLLPILTKKAINEAETDYYQALENLISLYNVALETNQKEMVELLKKHTCLLARKGDVLQLRLPKEIYLPTDSLKCWFEGDIDILILDERIWKLLENEPILEALSCKHSPEIKSIQPHIDTAHKEKLRHTPLYRESNGSDYEWVGLENVVQRLIDKNLSLIMWNFLCRALEDKNILRGYYRWQCTEHSHEKEFDSKICVQLKQTAWLLNREGQLCKPLELKFDELSDIYNYSLLGVELKSTLSLLGFKTDVFEELEKQGLRILTADMAAKFDELLQKEAKEEKSLNSAEVAVFDTALPVAFDWINELNSEEEVNVEQFYFKPKKLRDLRYKSSETFFDRDEEEEVPRIISKAVRKSIGDKSEQCVLNFIKKYCIDNADKNYHFKGMNEENKIGIGYDFVLMQGEKELRYIEVKGKTNLNFPIEISKAQIEFAKFLFNCGEGTKYTICVVTLLEKEKPTLTWINNPIQKWLNNELQLENFHFKLTEED